MNKKKLLKTILITLLIFIGLTWVIKTGTYSDAGEFTEGSLNPYGIFDLFQLPIQAFQTFSQYGVYLLIVGGFYGILKKTETYDKIVGLFSKKNKKAFLVITVITFALLSSLLGITMALFALVPFFKDVLETMGYDKKNAMLATIGSIFVGMIGSLCSFEINGYMKYFYEVEYTELFWVKLALLILIIVILIVYILKTNKEFNSKEIEYKKEVKIMPAIVISSIAIIVGFIGMYSWFYSLNFTAFDDLHSAIADIKLGDISILTSLFGLNLKALGNWTEIDFGCTLLIASAIISWIYGLKAKDIFDGFVNGAKKTLPCAIFVTLSFVIFITLYSSNDLQSIFYTIFDKIINLADKVSIIPMTLLSSIGTFLYGQFIYFSSDLSAPLMAAYEGGYGFMALIMQTIYGLTSFLAPTGMLLLGGLAYFDINYKEWIKHILKFVLITLVILIIIFLLVMKLG